MVVPPAVVPVTTPVPETTVATELDPVVHDPPGVASDNVVVRPEQMTLVPVIAAGRALTVKPEVVKQPAADV